MHSIERPSEPRAWPCALIALLAAFAENAAAQSVPKDGVWCGATGQGAGIYFLVTDGGTRVRDGNVGVRGFPSETRLVFDAPITSGGFGTGFDSPPGHCIYSESVTGSFRTSTDAGGGAQWSVGGGATCPFGMGSDIWGATWVAPVGADLAVSLSGPPGPVLAGTVADHAFILSNLGPTPVSCAGVTRAGNAVSTTITTTTGSFFGESDTCGIWSGPSLVSGATVTGVVKASTSPAALADLTLSVTAFPMAGTDPNPANDTGTVTTPLVAKADLAAVLSGPSAFTTPATLTYLVSVQQSGPSLARNVRVELAIDPPLALRGAWHGFEPRLSPCASPCLLGDLLPGDDLVRFDFDAPTSLVPPETLLVVAAVASDTTDSVPANNGATMTTTHLAPAPPSSFHGVAPCRVLDTRAEGYFPALCDEREVDVVGSACGIPATAVAVALNLTVLDAYGAGHLTLYPGGFPEPAVSAVNFGARQLRANNAVIGLQPRGRITLRPHVDPSFPDCVNAIVDVSGYFE